MGIMPLIYETIHLVLMLPNNSGNTNSAPIPTEQSKTQTETSLHLDVFKLDNLIHVLGPPATHTYLIV